MLRGNVKPLPPFHLLPKKVYCTGEAKVLLEICEQRARGANLRVYNERHIDSPPSPPLPAADRHPQVPVFVITRNYDFNSGALERFLEEHPIAVIKGLTDRVGFDTALFSPSTLSSVAPTLAPLGIHIQQRQHPDSNQNRSGEQTWLLESIGGKATLKQQSAYYKKEMDEETRRNGDAAPLNSPARFGVFPLPKDRFKEQHKAIDQLPKILRPLQPDDIITLSGMKIEGLYGAYSFIKTQGVRTPAHVEDGAVPSVNVGCGPGASDWLAVPREYVGIVEEAALKKGLRFGGDKPIWPSWKELESMGVPVWRFSQKKDEIVYTGAGVLHWVQGEGVGSNVAWNAGPITSQLIRNAVTQQEKNLSLGLSSTIPMERTSWKIAEWNNVSDWECYMEVRKVLACSLANAMMGEIWLQANRVVIKEMDDETKENCKNASFYCELCKRELFALFFFDRKDDAFCLLCIEKKGTFTGYSATRHYTIKELSKVYDGFTQPPIEIE